MQSGQLPLTFLLYLVKFSMCTIVNKKRTFLGNHFRYQGKTQQQTVQNLISHLFGALNMHEKRTKYLDISVFKFNAQNHRTIF